MLVGKQIIKLWSYHTACRPPYTIFYWTNSRQPRKNWD